MCRETATRNRSSAERLGARRRERLSTRSCCFMIGLSATTLLAPPGPRSLAIVVNRCAKSTSRSFLAEQGREDCYQEQVCLSCRFQVIIGNSPRTGAGNTPGDGLHGATCTPPRWPGDTSGKCAYPVATLIQLIKYVRNKGKGNECGSC